MYTVCDLECFQTRSVSSVCEEDTKYRTIDGTCNNLVQPRQGSSFTAFERILPANYEDGVSDMRGSLQRNGETILPEGGPFSPPYPSSRIVSDNIIRDRESDDSVLNLLHMTFGQFLDHDLTLAVEPTDVECDLTTCETDDVCSPIRVPADDQTFGYGTARNGSCLPFVRSLPACPTDYSKGRDPVNEITSYIDGSQIYGSTTSRAKFLREFSGGQLIMKQDLPRKSSLHKIPPCPPGEDGIVPNGCCPNGLAFCFVAGDNRVNEVTSLVVMHTLWLREHNRIAESLSSINPHWDDEKLYQESRKIVGALLQRITYTEYLKLIFGHDLFERLFGSYRNYTVEVDASILNAFSTAAFRFGHSQIQDKLHRLNESFEPIEELGPLDISDAFFAPNQYYISGGTDPITRGLLARPSRKVNEFLAEGVTKRLFEKNGVGEDLATRNIMRGRDHGLHSYSVWKRFCFNKYGIESKIKNQLTHIRLFQTYHDLDSADLWVGGLAEEPLEGSIVGATFACIMAIQFDNLRHGDSFYYERPGVFSESQLAEIKKVSMSRIICNNADSISEIQINAFKLDARVSCSAIPSMELHPWVDVAGSDCFVKFAVQPIAEDLNFFVRYGSTLIRSRYTVASGNAQQTRCASIECPDVEIVVQFSRTDLRRQCSYAKNSHLPASTSTQTGTYRAHLNTAVLLSPSGVYKSEADCESGTDIAVTFDCPDSLFT